MYSDFSDTEAELKNISKTQITQFNKYDRGEIWYHVIFISLYVWILKQNYEQMTWELRRTQIILSRVLL